MKAHLYKQILVSIRLLDAQRTVPIQPSRTDRLRPHPVRQGIVPAKHQDPRKGERTGAVLRTVHAGYRNHRVSEKARDAERLPADWSPKAKRSAGKSPNCARGSKNINELSNSGSQPLRALPATGIRPYAERPRHDRPGLRPDAGEIRRRTAPFVHRKVYLYQAQVWYNYIRHDMLTCYKYVCRWILLFDSAPHMKEADVRSLPAGILPAA